MQDASLFRPILIFVALLAIAQAVLVGIDFIYPEISVPAFVNFLIVLLAAMACGRVFAHMAKRLPTVGETLTFSAIAILLTLFVNVVFLAGTLIARGIPATGDNLALWMAGSTIEQPERAGFIMLGLAIAFGIGLLLGLAGFASGAWQALRARHPA
ncbi:MAG: hypothetical protein IAE87_07510 [Rhodobacteraceae bacterium]|jgi:hypothetical protein|nr:hypothetical protein [Paracoccaceae bacterium]